MDTQSLYRLFRISGDQRDSFPIPVTNTEHAADVTPLCHLFFHAYARLAMAEAWDMVYGRRCGHTLAPF